jgi:tRNA threonylcarbamoyladenosine biosynthesis protein TsaE
VTYLSAAPERTLALAEAIGRNARAGDLIALVGELGSGKTLFVGGLARGMGVEPAAHVSSPTFTIMHRYTGRLPLYHIDLYRLDAAADLHEVGLEEYLEGDGVAAVEWADHGWEILPKERLVVRLRPTGATTRAIELQADGDRYRILIEELARDVTVAEGFLAGEATRGGASR